MHLSLTSYEVTTTYLHASLTRAAPPWRRAGGFGGGGSRRRYNHTMVLAHRGMTSPTCDKTPPSHTPRPLRRGGAVGMEREGTESLLIAGCDPASPAGRRRTPQ